MFYTQTQSEALRFGDVLKGFCLTTPVIDKPIFEKTSKIMVLMLFFLVSR